MIQVDWQGNYRSEKIHIKGETKQQVVPYMSLFIVLTSRYIFQCVQCFKKIVGYHGQEFIPVNIVSFTIIIGCAMSYIYFKTSFCGGYADIVIILLTVYRYLMLIIIPRHLRTSLSIFITILVLIYLGFDSVTKKYNIQNLPLYTLCSVGAYLLMDISKVYYKKILLTKQQLVELQTNSIIINYLLWKILQIILIKQQIFALCGCILVLCGCILVINLIKVREMFDYHLGFIFKIVSDKNIPQIQSYYIHTQVNEIASNTPLQPLTNHTKTNNHNIFQINAQLINKTNKSLTWMEWVVVILVAFLQLILIYYLIGYFNNSNLDKCLKVLLIMTKLTLLCLASDVCKWTLSHANTYFYESIIYFFISIILVIPSGLMIIFSNKINVNYWLYNCVVVVVSYSVMHTGYIYMHLKRSNRIIGLMLLLYLLPGCGIGVYLWDSVSNLQSALKWIWILISFIAKMLASRQFFKAFITHINNIKIYADFRLYLVQLMRNTDDYFLTINHISFVIAQYVIAYTFGVFIDQQSLLQLEYIIVFVGLCYMYALMIVFHYNTHLQSHYSISKLPIIISFVCILLVVVYFANGSVSSKKYSLLGLSLSIIFAIMNELSYFIVSQMPRYSKFIKSLICIACYWMIVIPLMVVPLVMYGMWYPDLSFIYYYAIAAFFYISLISTLVGVVIHVILNLTLKAQKDLYIIKFMEDEMKKQAILEDADKILNMAQMYEVLNKSPQKLLAVLKSDSCFMVQIHQDRNIPYHYSLEDPQTTQSTTLQILQQQSQKQQKAPQALGIHQQQQNSPYTNFGLSQYNANFLQLTRLLTRVSKKKLYEQKCQTNQLQQSNVSLNQSDNKQSYIHKLIKLFVFLSEPSDFILQETFQVFSQVIGIQRVQSKITINNVYQKFSTDNQMKMLNFRDFILNYVQIMYDYNSHDYIQYYAKFCQNQYQNIIKYGQEMVRYHLFRKIVQIKPQVISEWLKNDDKRSQKYLIHLHRQRIKKAVILHHNKQNANIINPNIPKQQQVDIGKEYKDLNSNETVMKYVPKKNIQFKTPSMIYSLLVNSLMECYDSYQKNKQMTNFNVKKIKCTFNNVYVIVIKLYDIVMLFSFSTAYTFYRYYSQNFNDTLSIISRVDYTILLILSLSGLIIYVCLLFYHKNDFKEGSLGFDHMKRSITYRSLEYYTTSLIFIMGSTFASLVIYVSLNSFLCDRSTSLLYNFPTYSCYNYSHYTFMILGLLVFLIYYPLALIVFPFSNAIDRSLEIKYKAQFQVLYLQFRFFLSGINVIFNPFPFHQQSFIISLIKFIVCLVLYIISNKLKPCSFELMNKIQPKIYFILTVFHCAGVLCFFIGFKNSIIVVGSACGIYIAINLIVMFLNCEKQAPVESDDINELFASKQHQKKIFIWNLKKKTNTYELNIEDIVEDHPKQK